MSIPFTQYLMPNGKQKEVSIEMPSDIEATAHDLLGKGCRFDIEMLSTGLVSMTCEKGDEVLAIEICENNEKILTGVETIVKQAAAQPPLNADPPIGSGKSGEKVK